MIWGCAYHTSPTAWVIQGGSWSCSLLVPLPPATDALVPDVDSFSMTNTGPTAVVWARGSLLQLGSTRETLCPLGCTRYSSKWLLLRPLSLSSSCSPGGEVQWSARTLAPTRASRRRWRKRNQTTKKKGKRKKLEQRKKSDK